MCRIVVDVGDHFVAYNLTSRLSFDNISVDVMVVSVGFCEAYLNYSRIGLVGLIHFISFYVFNFYASSLWALGNFALSGYNWASLVVLGGVLFVIIVVIG